MTPDRPQPHPARTPRGAGRPRRALLLLTAALSTLLALGLAELGLRAWEWAAPRAGGPVYDYGDVWRDGGLGPGGFLQEGFSGRVRDGYGGTVPWVNNAAGFRRREETTPERAPGSLRVLSLGDSFTAGYRVGQEETFSHRLEKHLEATGRWSQVEVLPAVIEEPPTGLLYLSTDGLRWNPDLVLLGITLGNDLGQTFVTLDPRGELRLDADREPPTIGPNPEADQDALVAELRTWALPDGCFDPRAATPPDFAAPPEHEGGLRLTRLVTGALEARRQRRAPQTVASLWGQYTPPLLFDNNGLGMYLDPAPPRIRTAYDRLFRLLAAYRDLCAAHGVNFAVVLFPQRFEVQPRDWEATVRAYGLDPECFDLNAPERRIEAFCREARIPCLDPTDAMTRRFLDTDRSLYLPRGDMHWNARGHQAFADAVADELQQLATTPSGNGQAP